MATPRQYPELGSLRGRCGASRDLFNALHQKKGQKSRKWQAVDEDGTVLATAHNGELASLREWYRGLDVQIVRAS